MGAPPATLAQHVRQHARATPSHAAVVTADFTLDYAQLWRCALHAAEWIAARTAHPGDRVVLLAREDGWFPALYLGIHLAGRAAVPLDRKQPRERLRILLDQVDPALVLDGSALDALNESLAGAAARSDVAPGEVARWPAPADAADILFTSGSTGTPKGVVLSHGALLASAHNINNFIGNDGGDREVVTVPLHHSFGLGRLRCNLVAGGTIVLVPGVGYPGLVFAAMAAHRATGLSCVPAGMQLLLRAGEEDLANAAGSLRYVELGSAPMQLPAKRRLMQLLPRARLCMHYGLTEASRSAFIEFHSSAARLDSVGRATPGVALRIVDEQGRTVPPGTIGRIQVQAATLLREYWRDPARTAKVFTNDGWFDTQDLGRLDAEGYLYLAGRRDDQINVGGRKVHPLEVEAAATAEEDVQECACVGRPDPEGILGEVPVLYVVPRARASLDVKLLQRRLGRRLEPHAVPREVRLVQQLPRSESGKVLRMELRRMETGARP